MTANAPCAHIRSISTVKQPKVRECEECVKIGARWLYCYPDDAFAEY